MTTLWNRLEKNWLDIISVEFNRSEMAKLEKFLQNGSGHFEKANNDLINRVEPVVWQKI